MSEKIITPEDLADAQVLTTEEIGFNLDYKANIIPIDLQSVLLYSTVGVKFIIAKWIGDVLDKRICLGILSPSQTAVVGANVFTSHMSGKRDGFEEFAKNSAVLTYGAETIPRPKPELKEPILHGARLIGGGEISRNITSDVPYSDSLRDNFGLRQLPSDLMMVVRRLVLRKLEISSFL